MEHGNRQAHEVSGNTRESIICGWHFPVLAHAQIISLATVKCRFLLTAN